MRRILAVIPEVFCRNCGKQILGRKRPSELPKRVYCSNECRDAHSRGPNSPNWREGSRTYALCVICGKEFWYYKTMGNTGRYCSRKCAGADHWRKVGGRKNRNWKGDERCLSVMNQFRKRHLPNKCAICGWKEAGCDGHHIIPRKDGGTNNLGNTIVLCPNHHRLANVGILSQQYLLDQWQSAYGHLNLRSELLGN